MQPFAGAPIFRRWKERAAPSGTSPLKFMDKDRECGEHGRIPIPETSHKTRLKRAMNPESSTQATQQSDQIFIRCETVLESRKDGPQTFPGIRPEKRRRQVSHPVQHRRNAIENLPNPPVRQGRSHEPHYFPIEGIVVSIQEFQWIRMHKLPAVVLPIQPLHGRSRWDRRQGTRIFLHFRHSLNSTKIRSHRMFNMERHRPSRQRPPLLSRTTEPQTVVKIIHTPVAEQSEPCKPPFKGSSRCACSSKPEHCRFVMGESGNRHRVSNHGSLRLGFPYRAERLLRFAHGE